MNLSNLSCRQAAHDQAVEPRRESGRIVGRLAIENLRLVEQQRRKVGNVGVASLLPRQRQGSHQAMAHVEFEDRLGAGGAIMARFRSKVRVSTIPP
jgi:hypothetical protein